MYGDPPTREVSGAYFLPFKPNAPWGIYDGDFRIVEESVDLRGPERIPHSDVMDWPEDIGDIADAPNDVYIYCGRINPHFGHFLINSLPRFWPCLKAASGRRATLLCAEPVGAMLPFATDILSKLDIRPRELVSYDRPMRLKNVIVPAPSLFEQYWVYTIFKDLCDRIGRDMYRREDIDSVARPAYLSKSRLPSGVGRFMGEDKIEETLRKAGVDIVHPQTLSFKEQVRLFASRRICLGPTGSAFHTSIFAPAGRRFFCLNPAREINSNFVLIDKLNRNDATYFYQDGMCYSSSGAFLTEVELADVEPVAEDLLHAIETETDWRRP